jgi:hypothetical protein
LVAIPISRTKKFSLRVSAHPAFTLVKRIVSDNTASQEITEMLRFLAYEIMPNYQITPNWSVSAVYLQGNALQLHATRNQSFVSEYQYF